MKQQCKTIISSILIASVFFTNPVITFAVDASLSGNLQSATASAQPATPSASFIPFDPKEATQSNTPLPPPLLDGAPQQEATVSSLSKKSIDLESRDTQEKSGKRFERLKPGKLKKKVFQTKEKLSIDIPGGKKRNFSIKLHRKGTEDSITAVVTKTDEATSENTSLTITPPMTMVPGRYVLEIADEKGVVQNEEFVWGVLSLNPDKSIYKPNEDATLAIAVLDERGEMVCDANLTLTIVNGKDTITLSSENGLIRVTEQCPKKSFSLMPDYETTFKTGSPGNYQLTLTAVTKNGTYTITDTIEVRENPLFDVSRLSATRLFPEYAYPMIATITASEDFNGQITEVVPDFFDITPVDREQYPGVAQPDRIDTVAADQPGNVLGLATVALGLPFATASPSGTLPPPAVASTSAVLSAFTIADDSELGSPSALFLTQQSASDSANQLINSFTHSPTQPSEASPSSSVLGLNIGGYTITQGFGAFQTAPDLMKHYRAFNLIGHDGLDIALPVGTPILSVDEGKVVVASENWDYGATVVVEHDWGRSYYGHLSQLVVKRGEQVNKGALLAYSGNTGELTTGPHLHFGMKFHENDTRNGFKGKVDPAPYLGIGTQQALINTNRRAGERVKILTYNVNLKKGQTIKIGYNYKTPKQSPRLYRVGPLRFFNDKNNLIFAESRQWQLAIDAVYGGKTMRTIEYVLGNGSDNTSRASGTVVYAGTSWNTTKGSAGLKNVIIEGSGIQVRNAYLDITFQSGNGDINYARVQVDVEGSAAAGSNIDAGANTAQILYDTSGLSTALRAFADVTPFFDRQNDTQFNAGLDTVIGLNHTGGSNRYLSSVKLIITYEANHSTTASTQTKTVRFPLDSTVAGDTGSKRTACASSATCGFSYTADIPDATADADILDVWFEVTGEVNSATASTFTPQINGGAAGTAFNWVETSTDNTTVLAYFRPSVGSPNFQRNTAQTLDIVMGTVAMQALGGELVVTYRYSTGASEQTETIRYFMYQETSGNPGTGKTTFSKDIYISNAGFAVSNIWFKSYNTRSETNTLTLYGTVGAASEQSNAYSLGGTNSTRSARQPWLYYDMSADASSFTTSPTTIAGAYQWSSATGDAPVGVELFITFTWSGSSGGTRTKSLLFGADNQGGANIASDYGNKTYRAILSETTTKTWRDSYFPTHVHHTDATSIVNGTVTIGVNGNYTVITESAEEGTGTTEEGFNTVYYKQATSTDIGGTDITWEERSFMLQGSINQSDEAYFTGPMVFTYDAELAEEAVPLEPLGKQIKTVEYVLGNGTDTTTRTDNTLVYAGSSWNTTKGSAGTKTVEIEGSGISVKQAVIDMSTIVTSAQDVNNVEVTLDVEGGPAPGTSVIVDNDYAYRLFEDSGLSGYIRLQHDVTPFFDRQTDAEWNGGLDVVASSQIDLQGGSMALTNMKLILTYESDFSALPHTEVKTVRFPLDSTTTGDTGTKRTACAASATCGFSYNANIPDATADGDILDVWFELSAEVNSGTASNFTPQINGGSAGTAHNWVEAVTDDTNVNVWYRPSVGSPNFQRSTAQTLDIVNGTVPLNVLGGELIITYRYQTDAPSQTETISYYMDQDQADGSTAKNTFSQSVYISNAGFTVQNLWYKVRSSMSAGTTFTVFGTVGAAAEQSNAYTIAATNPRSGNAPTIYYDMTADAGSFTTSPTTIAGATQYNNANGGPHGVELYVTYTWNGTVTSDRTKTVKWAAPMDGVCDCNGRYNSNTIYVTLPEDVTKTYRSAYIETSYVHSDSTVVAIGTVTTAVQGVGQAIDEEADATSEAYALWYYQEISSTTFDGDTDIAWTKRAFKVTNTRSVTDLGLYGNTMFITYDFAADEQSDVENPTLSQLMRHGKWFNSFGVERPFTF